METIRTGEIFALYLFDIAEATDLSEAARIVGGSTRARLEPKAPTPAYFQYQQPPLTFEGAAVNLTSIDGFKPSFRIFDYGVVSLRLAKPFTGTWNDLLRVGQLLVENEVLERQSEQACRAVADRLATALKKPRQAYLFEDYLVFAVNDLNPLHASDDILTAHGDVVA